VKFFLLVFFILLSVSAHLILSSCYGIAAEHIASDVFCMTVRRKLGLKSHAKPASLPVSIFGSTYNGCERNLALGIRLAEFLL
jgi:hypothetical protein